MILKIKNFIIEKKQKIIGRNSSKKHSLGLFIGRFQPLHDGHLKVIRKISDECEHFIICIGSTNSKEDFSNPMSFNERCEMIENCLEKNRIRNYTIMPLEDDLSDEIWRNDLLELVKNCDVLYTGSNITNDLLKNNFSIDWLDRIDDISATEVRIRIAQSKEWENLVPECTARFIKSNKIDKRIQHIFDINDKINRVKK